MPFLIIIAPLDPGANSKYRVPSDLQEFNVEYKCFLMVSIYHNTKNKFSSIHILQALYLKNIKTVY